MILVEQCPNLEWVDLRNNSIPEFPSILPGIKLKVSHTTAGGIQFTISFIICNRFTDNILYHDQIYA